MRRRRVLVDSVALAVAVLLLLIAPAGVGASHLGDGKKHRIVYQLDDPGVDKARMKGMNVTLEQLARGAKPLPQGGVVRIMELQEQGFSYIRP